MSDVVITDLDGDPPDVVVNEIRTIVIMDLKSVAAERWVAANVPDPEWWSGSLVVSGSKIKRLLERMDAAGLHVI